MQTRRDFMKAVGAGALAARMGSSGEARGQSERPPNILFVLVDDMRWDQLAITGHPFAQTPHLDRIGREGVIFQNAFVTTPLCSPSRASFLTGQYPHQHRIVNNDRNGLGFISHKLVTFPQLLRRQGYETGYIGKWHMGDDDTRRPGFDRWISFKGQSLFYDPVVNVDGDRRQLTGYMTDFLNDWAAEFVRAEREKPFCLVVSHKAIHAPFLPAPRHENQYSGEDYVAPVVLPDDLKGKPVLTREVPEVDRTKIIGATPEPQEPRYGRPSSQRDLYLDHMRCLSSVDDGMGMLFEALEATGQLDDTLIVFASDNGFLLGEHGQFMDKRMPYDESIRIPLLMRYPKLIAAGSVRDQMVLNVDLAPTLYSLCGVKAPVPIHGRSLLPVLNDKAYPLRDAILLEHFMEDISPRQPQWQAVRTATAKYIHYPELDGMDELYDLATDPGEVFNRIGDTGATEKLKAMEETLGSLLAATGG